MSVVAFLGLLVREVFRVQPTIYRIKGKVGGQWYGWEEPKGRD